jgi:mannose-1-phosphate guanylyltransferase
MFQHTIDRADRLTPGTNRISVVSTGHRGLVESQLRGRETGLLLWQPLNRGTAAGILWPICSLMTSHADDIAVIYPSDHFVHPERDFLAAVSEGVRAVERKRDRLLLLGAEPDHLELDYGWIQPASEEAGSAHTGLRRVSRFVEKPCENEARRVMAQGALWNTLILIGRVRTLWQLGRYCLPETMMLLEWLRSATGGPRERELVHKIHAMLPEKNFSSEVLEKAPELFTVMPLRGVEWSDWGRPERIVQSIRRLGRTPAFPSSLVTESDPRSAVGMRALEPSPSLI